MRSPRYHYDEHYQATSKTPHWLTADTKTGGRLLRIGVLHPDLSLLLPQQRHTTSRMNVCRDHIEPQPKGTLGYLDGWTVLVGVLGALGQGFRVISSVFDEKGSCVALSFPGAGVSSLRAVSSHRNSVSGIFSLLVQASTPRTASSYSLDCCWRRPMSRCPTRYIADANTRRWIFPSFGSISHRRVARTTSPTSTQFRLQGRRLKYDCMMINWRRQSRRVIFLR